MEIYSGSFPLEHTICGDCKHRMSRLMIPLDYEALGIDLQELGIEDGEDVIMEQHVCLVTHEDLEGLVQECSHHAVKAVEFFKGNPPI